MPKPTIKHEGRGMYTIEGMRSIYNGRCHAISFKIHAYETSPTPGSMRDEALNYNLMPQIARGIAEMEYLPGEERTFECDDCTEDCILKEEG